MYGNIKQNILKLQQIDICIWLLLFICLHTTNIIITSPIHHHQPLFSSSHAWVLRLFGRHTFKLCVCFLCHQTATVCLYKCLFSGMMRLLATQREFFFNIKGGIISGVSQYNAWNSSWLIGWHSFFVLKIFCWCVSMIIPTPRS